MANLEFPLEMWKNYYLLPHHKGQRIKWKHKTMMLWKKKKHLSLNYSYNQGRKRRISIGINFFLFLFILIQPTRGHMTSRVKSFKSVTFFFFFFWTMIFSKTYFPTQYLFWSHRVAMVIKLEEYPERYLAKSKHCTCLFICLLNTYRNWQKWVYSYLYGKRHEDHNYYNSFFNSKECHSATHCKPTFALPGFLEVR